MPPWLCLTPDGCKVSYQWTDRQCWLSSVDTWNILWRQVGRWPCQTSDLSWLHHSTTPHLTPHLLPLPCLLNIHIPSSLPTQQSSQHNPPLERKCWLFGQRRVRDVDLLPVFRKLDCVISHLLCTAGSRGINREKSTNIQTENYLSSVDLIRTDVLIVLNKAN